MGAKTSIEWTDFTFNPWWGCTRVSPGCEHCYAEAFAKRTGHGVWGVNAPRRFFGEAHWREPHKWNEAAQRDGVRLRVFCASMADVFEDRAELEPWRKQLWRTIHETPALDWLILTKRPENLKKLLPWYLDDDSNGVPPHNVWLGTTVEDQQRARERITLLADAPAAVRFLSCEPMLERIDLGPYLEACFGIDWVIVGGESGAGARRFTVGWARDIVRQCRLSEVPCFVKQMGSKAIAYDEKGIGTRLKLLDAKGGDLTEWPEDLRVRQFPRMDPWR